jgi:hypothetical protein
VARRVIKTCKASTSAIPASTSSYMAGVVEEEGATGVVETWLVKVSGSYTAFEPDQSGSGPEIRERGHESQSKSRV